MTFRQILTLMGGLHHGVAHGVISRGIADGLIEHLLEERGIYGSKEKGQTEGAGNAVYDDIASPGLDCENKGSACENRTQVYRERLLH